MPGTPPSQPIVEPETRQLVNPEELPIDSAERSQFSARRTPVDARSGSDTSDPGEHAVARFVCGTRASPHQQASG
jgi:hypothetical protein